MIDRNIKDDFHEYLSKYPILALTGPRQSGKTTFLKTNFPEYQYVTLENPENRVFAIEDPKGFLNQYNQKVILDEVQRTPELFSYLQGIVDDSGMMGQYIISGSQNFHLIEQITQSLAGRVGIFRLFPFDLSEIKLSGIVELGEWQELIIKGFYPAIYDRNIPPQKYYQDYIDTYLKKDIALLINLHDESAFYRFLRLCATRAGQLVNFEDLSRDTGVSNTTIKRWLSLLETSYIIYFLQPYYKNFSKRIIKSPKLYFYDCGLLSNLLNINEKVAPENPYYGVLFENMMVSDLIKTNYHKNLGRNYWYWRSSHGKEVDLLYEQNNKIHTYEIKASSTVKSKFFANLQFFESITVDQTTHPTLIYGGDTAQLRSKSKVLPWASPE